MCGRQEQRIEPVESTCGDLAKLVRCPHDGLAERLDPEPSQRGEVRAATKRLAQIAHQAAHIGARTAFDVQLQIHAITFNQVEMENLDFAHGRLHILATARAFVQRHTALLER